MTGLDGGPGQEYAVFMPATPTLPAAATETTTVPILTPAGARLIDRFPKAARTDPAVIAAANGAAHYGGAIFTVSYPIFGGNWIEFTCCRVAAGGVARYAHPRVKTSCSRGNHTVKIDLEHEISML